MNIGLKYVMEIYIYNICIYMKLLHRTDPLRLLVYMRESVLLMYPSS